MTPATNATRATKTLTGWISFDAPGRIRSIVLVVAVVIAVALVIKLVPSIASIPAIASRAREIWPLIVFVVAYLGYMVVSASITAFADLDTRLLISAYVPLVVIGAWTFERVRDHLPASGRTVLAVIAVSWIAVNVGWFGVTAVDAARHGAGDYSTPEWHRSRLLDDVQYMPSGVPLYSNDIYAVELFARRAAVISPAETFQESNEETGALPPFVRRVRCVGHITLVWFLPNRRPYLYSPQALSQHVRLTTKIRRADRVIYDVTPLPSSPIRCRR